MTHKLPPSLFQKWLRSQEEEKSSSEQIYRPESYPFPRARGRSGFNIEDNGHFLYLGIAPEDGRLSLQGQWNRHRKNYLNVTLESGIQLTIKLLKIEPNLLVIKLTQSNH